MLYEIHPGVYAIESLPVAYISISNFKALAIADIHLGFEEYMATKGISLPRMQLAKAIEIIDKALNIVGNVDTLIIVGDAKHLFDKLGKRESKDLSEFLLYTKKRFGRVVLVRGNHDNFIYSVSLRYGIEFCEKLEVGDILFVHGHKRTELGEKKLVIMGHEHPSISLKDPATGTVYKFPCFLKVPLKNGGIAIVLPAAGAYQSGTSVSTSPESYLSPIIKSYGVLEKAKPYAISEKEGFVYELPQLSVIEDLLSLL